MFSEEKIEPHLKTHFSKLGSIPEIDFPIGGGHLESQNRPFHKTFLEIKLLDPCVQALGTVADFGAFPVAARPKSGPEGRVTVRKHYCVGGPALWEFYGRVIMGVLRVPPCINRATPPFTRRTPLNPPCGGGLGGCAW